MVSTRPLNDFAQKDLDMNDTLNVPFIDISRFEKGFHESVSLRFAEMVKNARFVGGEAVKNFEHSLAQAQCKAHAVTCANGTDALQLALRAVDVSQGDLVLVPDLTFWATFEAVVNVGARPVTVAADIVDGGVSLEAFQSAVIELSPKAAIIAHLYGWGTRHLSELRSFCAEQGVILIEDGAQAYGVQFCGDSIFKDAHIATLSFYPAKVLGAAGDGGAVMTDDENLAQKLRQLGNHGRSEHYGHAYVGWNSRMDALQAAYLSISMSHIDARLVSRRASARFYYETLPAIGVKVMKPPSDYSENGYCNVCLFENVAQKSYVEARLREAGIGFGNIYPGVMSSQPGAKPFLAAHYGGAEGQLLCRSVLNLPLFPYMTDTERNRVLQVVSHAVGKYHG